METEQLFWQRFMELAKASCKASVFEYYISEARLVHVKQDTALIHLSSRVKVMFWNKNMDGLLIHVGAEVYNEILKIEYEWDEDQILQPNFSTPFHSTSLQSEPPFSSQTDAKTQEVPQALPVIETGLQEEYTFQNFIQGDGNSFAYVAAMSVAEEPGTRYNPLFIFGGPGLGKTHLLNAIGNKVLQDNPQMRVRIVSSETFLNEFIEHTRLNNMEEFKKLYRNLDVLLIDDIQTLKNKKATQEEFFNTFNAIYENKKQIVLTSDRTPTQLDNLQDRLVTRFGWGTVTEVSPPDYETRIAILQTKAENYTFQFTDDTLAYLANQFHSNVRDLEGALKDIQLLANMRQLTEITVDLAAEAIRARKNDSPKKRVISIEQIQTEVGSFYGVSVKEIKGAKRVQNVVHARQVAMYLAREMTDNSLPKIGKEFGNRDHTTVMHSYNKIKTLLEEDPNLEIEITSIRNKIR
ncbi:chromosomal replication initiator protein DnaA [Streptococcus sp. DD13]|uniref:chromosomal replication initiator protein DnaA n=1 Tax=Streptococcus sp. DD13 TaxID=1777881 RepID=UPI0007994DEF|nr:chromosomal replication initiator protein DnaA [Streptococcus sp. DD13]KXT77775.1 Chromosomal replication initiator protein DnaA [Streptococcus sp. DD13]